MTLDEEKLANISVPPKKGDFNLSLTIYCKKNKWRSKASDDSITVIKHLSKTTQIRANAFYRQDIQICLL